MARLSSIFLACACAVLCCSTLVSAAFDLGITATYQHNGSPVTLANGGTTVGTSASVTFIVTLSEGPSTSGELITMTCTDSAGSPAAVGSFSPASASIWPGGSNAGLSFSVSTATAELPIRCTAVGDTEYLTQSAEFTFYNGVRWAATSDATTLAAGQQATLTAQLFPADAISATGSISVTFTVDCEGLDVIDLPSPDRRRLLATSGSTTVSMGQSSASWTLTGPSVPQATLTCTFTRSGGDGALAALPTSQDVVVTMTLPTVTWDASSWPSVITIGEAYDVTLTLSQQCTGILSLQGTCQSGSDAGSAFNLPAFSFQDEETKMFTIPAGVFVTPMTDVQCRVWWASGDAFFTNLDMSILQPARHEFSVVAAESSTASQQQASTAAQHFTSSGFQQSTSSSASVATSSGQNGGASSSTGAPCIPGLTCAAASAQASWAILALAAAAVLGALVQ